MKQVGRSLSSAVEGVEERLQIVAAEVRHQLLQRTVVVLVEHLADARRVAEVATGAARRQAAPPLYASAEYQEFGQSSIHCRSASPPRRVERLPRAARPYFSVTTLPVHAAEDAVEPKEQAVGDHRIEALAVVVDDPPDIPDVVLPRFEHRLEDIAFVELRVAGEGNHPPRARSGSANEVLRSGGSR